MDARRAWHTGRLWHGKIDSAFPADNVRQMAAPDWVSLSDEQLLERRISTLGLSLEGTALDPLINQLI